MKTATEAMLEFEQLIRRMTPEQLAEMLPTLREIHEGKEITNPKHRAICERLRIKKARQHCNADERSGR